MTARFAIRAFVCWMILGLPLTACENFGRVGKRTRQGDVLRSEMRMNQRDYTGSDSDFSGDGCGYVARRDVAVVFASAYSGRCGLDFVNFVESLSGMGGNIFLFLMGSYPSSTDQKISDCLQAETLLNAIGAAPARNAEENVLMGFSSLTKTGTVLARYADADDDGVTDASFDHCDLTDFPDTAVREIGTGLANAILSIDAVASDLVPGTLSAITSICAQDPNLNVFCTNTDATAYSVNEVRFLRALVGSSGQGIGACAGNFSDCICP